MKKLDYLRKAGFGRCDLSGRFFQIYDISLYETEMLVQPNSLPMVLAEQVCDHCN